MFYTHLLILQKEGAMGFNLVTIDTSVLLRIAMDHGNNNHRSRAKSLVRTPGMYFTVLDQAIPFRQISPIN